MGHFPSGPETGTVTATPITCTQSLIGCVNKWLLHPECMLQDHSITVTAEEEGLACRAVFVRTTEFTEYSDQPSDSGLLLFGILVGTRVAVVALQRFSRLFLHHQLLIFLCV